MRKRVLGSLITILAIAFLAIIVTVATIYIRHSQCKKQLESLGAYLMQYNADSGKFPASMNDLPDFLPKSLLSCPAKGGTQYDFIDVSKIQPPLGVYPLLIDSTLQNHYYGVYILFTDGHVEWDSQRKKLRSFLLLHPEVKYDLLN